MSILSRETIHVIILLGDGRMEFKKSYKGFIIWMIVFMISIFFIALLPIEDESIAIKLVSNITSIDLTILTYIIYKTEYIYWYTGLNYEDALKAGSDKRKEYGYKHFKTFLHYSVIVFIYSIFAYCLGIPYWIDILIFVFGVIITVISTMRIEL